MHTVIFLLGQIYWAVNRLYGRLFMYNTLECVGRVAQSIWRLTTGLKVRVSNPGGARFSALPDRL
jgi:hypothetical protein